MLNLAKKFKINLFHIIFANYFYFITVILALIIFGSSYFLFFQKDLKRVRAGELNPANQELILRQEKDFFSNLKKIKQDYELLDQNAIEKFDLVLTRESDVYALLTKITNLAENNHLIVSSIAPAKSESGTINISLVVKGPRTNFIKFLESLEKKVRIIDIPSGTISFSNNQYSLNLQAYFIQ